VHELAGIKNPVEAYETLTRLAQMADQSGYDSLWLSDHFIGVDICGLA
jgi:alkanesulfonate monooxygenase SsuD/methylene tetrahydromethanopterin reductase-like flavin-dependent oxidoreductase (luciferase family)